MIKWAEFQTSVARGLRACFVINIMMMMIIMIMITTTTTIIIIFTVMMMIIIIIEKEGCKGECEWREILISLPSHEPLLTNTAYTIHNDDDEDASSSTSLLSSFLGHFLLHFLGHFLLHFLGHFYYTFWELFCHTFLTLLPWSYLVCCRSPKSGFKRSSGLGGMDH